MKIAVLGASSFSGNAFANHAELAGYDCVRLSRPLFDINRPIESDLGRFDAVVNFIALNMVGESWDQAADYYQTNVVGTARLADALMKNGVKKFVQVSTPEVYGTTQTFLKEGAPFNPTTPYAISRAACDMHLQALHRQYGFPVCFTRTVNVYGPGQQLYRIIPKTILCALTGRKLQLHGGGVSTRAFIHIRDVANAILKVCKSGAPGETYHVSTPRQTSIADLVRMICERVGVGFDSIVEPVAERPGKDMAYQLDDSKIRQALGWLDITSLERGLEEVVRWVTDNLETLRGQSLEYEHRP